MHPMPRDLVVVSRIHGVLCTAPVDTWCALSAMLSFTELVVIGDWLVRREDPLSDLDTLHRAVKGYAGRHGAKRLREAVEVVRPRTDSPKESEVRLHLAAAGLPCPAVNHVIRDGRGDYIRRGDMVYADEKVLVEYDGDQHRTDRAQYVKDQDHLDRLRAAGWIVIRIRSEHLRSPGLIAARVRRALATPVYERFTSK